MIEAGTLGDEGDQVASPLVGGGVGGKSGQGEAGVAQQGAGPQLAGGISGWGVMIATVVATTAERSWSSRGASQPGRAAGVLADRIGPLSLVTWRATSRARYPLGGGPH